MIEREQLVEQCGREALPQCKKCKDSGWMWGIQDDLPIPCPDCSVIESLKHVQDGCFVAQACAGPEPGTFQYCRIGVTGKVSRRSDGSVYLSEYHDLNGLLNGMDGMRVRVIVERIEELEWSRNH
jgi:hypothetical protein